MPLYEYQCDACEHRFEVIQKFSDSPIDKCPKCGGGVHKLQSAPAFQFKGTGWYVTDYAKSGQSDSRESRKASENQKDEAKSKDGAADATSKPDSPSTSASAAPSTAGTATGPAGTKGDG
jgi:putative FmdB family regulatory protein